MASPSLKEKFIALQRRAKVVPRSLYQRNLLTMIKLEKSFKICFFLLAAEAAQKFTNRKQLHSVMNLSSTQNLVLFGLLVSRMIAFRFFLVLSLVVSRSRLNENQNIENTSLSAELFC